ncbi:MAG: fumarylacetoacetate hydrolase family protein [Acidimicrobiales bacterium]|nr:MAG: fumarylacetoacetase [Pseudonocardiales bacterium]
MTEAILAYGVDHAGQVVARDGDRVVDLALIDGLDVGREVWSSGSLNAFMALGPDAWSSTQTALATALSSGSVPAAAMRPLDEVSLVLAWGVADYVDFYASEAHATHMGELLRPDSPSLPAAWRHLPIGYHGRSSTVVVSGSEIPRPCGLTAGGDAAAPTFGPSGRLDVEVELGFVVGVGSARGQPIPAERAGEHVFGVVLVNDWSARDIQGFEYQPLGPMLGKSFATSVSPWVVPLTSLSPWQVDGPVQQPTPAPYLRVPEPRNLDIRLELSVNGSVLSQTSAAGLYWSMAQQLAHLTINGASVRTGDLFASGTISGWDPGSEGSLMELTRAGKSPLRLSDDSQRSWLADGDIAVIRGWCCTDDGAVVILDEVSGRIVAPLASGGPLVAEGSR